MVKRGTDEFLGYLKKDPGRSLVNAENSRLFIPFKILGDNRNGQPGDKVVRNLFAGIHPLESQLVKLFCSRTGDDPLTDHQGILAKFGLSGSFPTKVEEQANAIGQSVQAKEIKRRMDFRDIFTLTIDPLDARDFDDALSVQKINDDEWEIGVHIADVSYYVPLNSALDKEARKRGNSTYLVGEVVPMLPQSLSNGICSLVEGQDRLVKSVLFHFRNDGKMLNAKLAECVINSNKRLTYEQAILFLRGNRLESIKKPNPRLVVTPEIPVSLSKSYLPRNSSKSTKPFNDCGLSASKLRTERMRAGSLNLESAEIKAGRF